MVTSLMLCVQLGSPVAPAHTMQAGDSARVKHVLESMFPPEYPGPLALRQLALPSLPNVLLFVGSRAMEHNTEYALVAMLPDCTVIPLGARLNRQILHNAYRTQIVRRPVEQYALDLAVLDGAVPVNATIVSDTSALPQWARDEVKRLHVSVVPPTHRANGDGIEDVTMYLWADSLWYLRVRITRNPWHDSVDAELVIGNPPG